MVSRILYILTLISFSLIKDAIVESNPRQFNFSFFEKNSRQPEFPAEVYLRLKYPAGSSTEKVITELEDAGAKCTFVQSKKPYYFCTYNRPASGLMFFVSTIEWAITIFTDPQGKAVNGIGVGRGATGM